MLMELGSAPLLGNILPHLQALVVFITNTLPKPVLVALLYRLVVLHFASRILPAIGADSWEGEAGVDYGWDERPVRMSLFNELRLLTTTFLLDISTYPPCIDLSPVNLCDRVLSFTT